MAATVISFRWLELLEKEFDTSFVDLDLFIGEIEDIEDREWLSHVRAKLGALSSCFAQLAHKAQTIFQANAKLEAELLNLRHELAESEAKQKLFKEDNHYMLMQLHASQLKLHKNVTNADPTYLEDTEKIRERLENELEEERMKRLPQEIPKEELVLLSRENEMLKKYVLNLQGELNGAKLTSKYLDKELAGRIQQLQLLSRELNGEQHEKLWKQLEAEIFLHRHKTVVRACRTTNIKAPRIFSRSYSNENCNPPKPPKSQNHRFVNLQKTPDEELGMCITGGREHGVPILISVLHDHLPAGASKQLFVGDAILSVNGRSLKDCSHSDAVEILSSIKGEMCLEVVFVAPDDDDESSLLLEDPSTFKYQMFDDEVASVTSSLHLLQNGRLSRASIDSIRGSTDNILESPRHLLDTTIETPDDIEVPPPPNKQMSIEEPQIEDFSSSLQQNIASIHSSGSNGTQIREIYTNYSQCEDGWEDKFLNTTTENNVSELDTAALISIGSLDKTNEESFILSTSETKLSEREEDQRSTSTEDVFNSNY